MNEDIAAVTQREGEITFAAEDKADETASESQSGEENNDKGTQSPEGDKNTQGEDDKTPFHEHPRWKKREEEWNTRFNEQETRHQDDLKAIREEFGGQRKENAQQTKIPAWFGGTQEQWDAYRTDRDAEIQAAEDRAITRLKKEQGDSTKAEETAVKEATDYMNSEVDAIEADKTLNPAGGKIDRKALLQVVLDNQLVDTKGRWNYRAGIRILNAGAKAPEVPKKDPKDNERKQVAAATTVEGKGDDKKPTFATSDTFKKDRPW